MPWIEVSQPEPTLGDYAYCYAASAFLGAWTLVLLLLQSWWLFLFEAVFTTLVFFVNRATFRTRMHTKQIQAEIDANDARRWGRLL